jgi:predicted GH43/DUF377 family glycosyl hydrolase
MGESMTLKVRRLDLQIERDPRRVLLRPLVVANKEQGQNILSRVLAIPQDQLSGLLRSVMSHFEERHRGLRELFLRRFEEVRFLLPSDQELCLDRKTLAGSYFYSEYAVEAAALFNPSIVLHPDQSDVSSGAVRFILSLRATGEGHVSSIAFRSGVLDAEGEVTLDPASLFAVEPRRLANPLFEKELFGKKLFELGLASPFSRRLSEHLEDEFSLEDLRDCLARERWRGRNLAVAEPADPAADDAILALAIFNYEVEFRPEQALSERVLFPSTPSQQNGIEDARFVRFEEEGEPPRYYATYTAYDGRLILPQLIETDDFIKFRFITLNGPEAQNKGMALFPRKIKGHYAMLSRQGGENIRLMFSDNIHFWYESRVLVRPRYPWELIQIGNCGSPIETDAGWLVLSHGVGPMRKYCIGAYLLDLEDPRRLIGRLAEPMLVPTERERDGYVPNVVYSCGGLIHNGTLLLPFGVSDQATRFASVDLDDLLKDLTRKR